MNILLVAITVFVLITNVVTQVPYDYIPIGRQSRREWPGAHPSDINLNYEHMFPSRRRYSD